MDIWPEKIALIPTMTSNTTPAGIASASSTFDERFPAYKAFAGEYWLSAVKTEQQWIEYQFSTEVRILTLECECNSSETTDSIGSYTIVPQYYHAGTWINAAEEQTKSYHTSPNRQMAVFSWETNIKTNRIRLLRIGYTGYARWGVWNFQCYGSK